MGTLIVYDNTGKIFYSTSGTYDIPNGGIQFVEMEIPKGQHAIGVNVSSSPHQVILEDIPKTETELINDKLDNAILELTTLISMGGM